MDSLYLVDGSNFLFRAFHAMPPMTTKAGVPTGAVRGFASMLLRLIGDERPSHLAVVFDAGGRDKRAELFPAYKQNRDECPPELRPQFDMAHRMVKALGLVSIEAVDAEADDVIATLAVQARLAGLPVVIVSSDKDLMQLVVDGGIELLDTMKEEGRGKRFGSKEVTEKWGVGPSQLGDVLALMGDSSDNIPGVPGVGPKTAAQLIGHFGSLDAVIKQLQEKGDLGDVTIRGKDKLAATLREHREQLDLTRKLVALDEAVPLSVGIEQLGRKTISREDLLGLLNELEFTTLLRRLTAPGGMPGMPDLSDATIPVPPAPTGKESKLVAPVATDAKSAAPAPELSESASELERWIAAPATAPEVILTEAQLRTWLGGITGCAGLALVPLLCGEGHKAPSARLGTLVGLALFTPTTTPAYIPFCHRYLGAPTQLTLAEALPLLAPILGDAKVRKLVYGSKDVYLALDAHGIKLDGVVSDPALCSYLLNPAETHTLGALAARHLPPGYPPLELRESLCQSGKHALQIDQIDAARTASYATGEARAIFLLGELLLQRLGAESRTLLDKLELPLARVLATIERHGILIDVPVLERLSRETEAKLRALEADIERQAGVRINLNSPKQLAELLFEKMGLQSSKKTRGKTGMSVDAEVLESLAAENPIARQIMEHRSLTKLKGTYMDQFPLLRDKQTGRLHTSFQQVVAATGRLSSTEPNLQNIPIRSELGQEIRRAFIAPPGHQLIAADYSQIELRVLAHLSGDPLLTESFRNGEDVHARTAIEMFGPEEGKTSDKRRAAKMINYGIIYGLTDYGLATRLGIERKVAKQYILEYFARYRRVQEFMDELVARARSEGGARTLLGRFRPLPELNGRNFPLRGYAERMAKNTPIQGTAADILKQAMIDVQAELTRQEPQARMLLTVHDELVLETPTERAESVGQLVQQTMERAAVLSVPLKVDVGIAHSWADC